jgi:hypothetical protein
MSWKVWGDPSAPVFEGTEEESKAFVVGSPDRDSLYVEDESGNEYEEDRSTGSWRLIE